MTKKAYSYVRVSSLAQEQGTGIERQIALAQKWADDNGYLLADPIADIGVSAFKGKNATEGGFAKFLAAIEAGKIERGSILIVESLDRLSRQDPVDAQYQLLGILKGGVDVVTLADNQHYSKADGENDQAKLFISLAIAMRAYDESLMKSKRRKASWEFKLKNANEIKITAASPAWLKLSDDKKKFFVIEEKVNAVRKIFEMAINGYGVNKIAAYMNEHFEPIARSKKWNTTYVHYILNSETVIGKLVVKNGKVFENYYPSIIDKETFYLAQNRKSNRRKKGGGRSSKLSANIFTKTLMCGKCGSKVSYRDLTKDKRQNILRCHNAIHSKNCDCRQWIYSEFLEGFFQFVGEVSFAQIFSGEDSQDKIDSLNKIIYKNEGTIAALTERNENIVANMMNAKLPQAMIDKLGAEMFKIEDDISKAKRNIEDAKSELSSVSNQSVSNDQRQLLDLYQEQLAEKDEDKIVATHMAMRQIIQSNIDVIKINNCNYARTWEELPKDVIKKLQKDGYDTIVKLDSWLQTRSGLQFSNKVLRYFEVTFKNGEKRIVWPYGGMTFHSSESLFSFLKGMLK